MFLILASIHLVLYRLAFIMLNVQHSCASSTTVYVLMPKADQLPSLAQGGGAAATVTATEVKRSEDPIAVCQTIDCTAAAYFDLSSQPEN